MNRQEIRANQIKTYQHVEKVLTGDEAHTFAKWATEFLSLRPVADTLDVFDNFDFSCGLIEHAYESCDLHEVVPDAWLSGMKGSGSDLISQEYWCAVTAVLYVAMALTELFNDNGELSIEAAELIGDITHRMVEK
tara:strand:- start:204 stop:608 length:405 start_codon:yes stop_codon:yes gene_type:complete